MMDRIRSLIYYATVIFLILGMYFVGRTYTIGMIEDFKLMEPVIKPSSVIVIKRGPSVINTLQRDDIIVYWRTLQQNQPQRIAGRIAALPGQVVTVKDKRVCVDDIGIANAPAGLEVLSSGMIIPRDTAFILFDSPPQADQRVGPHAYLVRFSDIEGRVTR